MIGICLAGALDGWVCLGGFVGFATVGSATVGSATVGFATVGFAVGFAAVGFLDLEDAGAAVVEALECLFQQQNVSHSVYYDGTANQGLVYDSYINRAPLTFKCSKNRDNNGCFHACQQILQGDSRILRARNFTHAKSPGAGYIACVDPTRG
jgi:hypothetical protein